MSENSDTNKKEASTSKIERDAYIWNTASGLLMAFQSVIMLMVLMRVCDVVEAGVFTIAYANANLFLNLGKYGMRNFQVSDISRSYSYKTYARSRMATTAAMIVLGIAYLAYSAFTLSYSIDKVLVILVMLVFKAADSIEDVYMGNCQQYGRLDVAAKALTWRLITTIIVYAVGIVILQSQLVPLIIATVFTFAFCVGEYIWMRRKFGLPKQDPSQATGSVISLLKTCFPLFLATFLLFYIGNAPKYAIDALMDDAAQAYYGFIAMPVFVVSLLASFIYNPIIKSLAEDWYEGRNIVFLKRLGMQSIYIVGITIVCDLGALLIGVPVLNILYSTHLEDYLVDLIVLVSGGGFLALVTLFTTGITIMRKQNTLFVGYIGVTIFAAIGSPWAVQAAGIDGASWIYLALMGVLALWFGAILTWKALTHPLKPT